MTNTLIKILYGPYEAHGIIRHKVQKIYGLTSYLSENGYPYEMQPSPHLNRLTIEMGDRVIYTCDIRFLKFNISIEDDKLCQRIIDVIKSHKDTFSKTSNTPKFRHVSEGIRCHRQQDFDSDYEDSTESFDYFIPLGAEDWDMNLEADSRSYQPLKPHSYVSEDDNEEMDKKSDSSSVKSCVCLSLEPPSIYSFCYGPPTPLNTEMSITDIDASSLNLDLNEEVDDMLNNEDWRALLDQSVTDVSFDFTPKHKYAPCRAFMKKSPSKEDVDVKTHLPVHFDDMQDYSSVSDAHSTTTSRKNICRFCERGTCQICKCAK